LWIGALTIAGYLLGEVALIRDHIDAVCIGIILLSVLPIIIGFFRSKLAARKQ
jgi:membrane-associated protein